MRGIEIRAMDIIHPTHVKSMTRSQCGARHISKGINRSATGDTIANSLDHVAGFGITPEKDHGRKSIGIPRLHYHHVVCDGNLAVTPDGKDTDCENDSVALEEVYSISGDLDVGSYFIKLHPVCEITTRHF